jgi:hypothetical protein
MMKRLVRWIMRVVLLLGRRPASAKAGFVLPTTVLLLLVVTLTVGAIGYRTYTRTQQTSGERLQRVIANAATPAIDRARAKIEFLFDPNRDSRAGGVPSQAYLLGMMLNDGQTRNNLTVPRFPSTPTAPDPYTFASTTPPDITKGDEVRIDINGDGQKDNAWKYRADLDGDGRQDATVLYSIIMTAPQKTVAFPNDSPTMLMDSTATGVSTRAQKLQVRNAPLSNANSVNPACVRGNSGGATLLNGDGWFPDPVNQSKLRKNFQVNAYVVKDNNNTVSTLEFQQDREATQGFKWGAWFRNDLEIFPGAPLRWNGAMHTEGNFIVGSDKNVMAYMISSPKSCLYDKTSSEITTAKIVNANDIPTFEGQFITGTVRDNRYDGTALIDLWNGQNANPINREMTQDNDSVDPRSVSPIDFTLEPVVLQTQDRSVARSLSGSATNPGAYVDTRWPATPFATNDTRRMYGQKQPTPYVDDLYRADNRYGPKARMKRENIPIPGAIGTPIPASEVELVRDDPASDSDSESVGLDGYWERRARREGLRLIVGQRLELGDPAGWGGPTDDAGKGVGGASIGPDTEPLRPAKACSGTRCNEKRQRRALWDNLAAVQATAIYHANTASTVPDRSIDYPLACMATTVHPGTAGTLARSASFSDLTMGLSIPGYPTGTVISDFFHGLGTNGWEYAPPSLSQFTNPNSKLITALTNLANYAGDENGGAPSFTPVQDDSGSSADAAVHPYPSMAMWGDFSKLRRVLRLLRSGGYSSLSPADKTTLHTAGCTIGMLAYNLDYLEKLDDNVLNTALSDSLGEAQPLRGTSSADVETYARALKGLRGRLRLIKDVTRPPLPGVTASTLNEAVKRVNPDPWLEIPEHLFRTLSAPTSSSALGGLVLDGGKSEDPDTLIQILTRWRDDPNNRNLGNNSNRAELRKFNQQIAAARLIALREQVARDRELGFYGTYGDNSAGGLVTSRRDGLAKTPLGKCKAWNDADDALAMLCSARPRYPILYSLFPASVAGLDFDTNAPADLIEAYSGSGKSFVSHKDAISSNLVDKGSRDAEDADNSYIGTFNGSVTYQVIRPEDVAIQPRKLEGSWGKLGGSQSWLLPSTTAGGVDTPNSNRYNLISVCADDCQPWSEQPSTSNNYPQFRNESSYYRIPFKDSVLYNGREMLPARVLDLDLDLMRTRKDNLNNDFWLPTKGLIYAFREDAVSEADIVRPLNSNWTSCDTEAKMQATAGCRMNTLADAYNSTDPPLNETLNARNLITPKPVDYLPDPDRRPHGFRLRQGKYVYRGPADFSQDSVEGRGLSFITANPAYVQGDFNLHQVVGSTGTATQVEEFVETVTANFSNFYSRGGGAPDTPTGTDSRFAQPTKDTWRPSEVLADAVTILSANFCDGSIEDTFMTGGVKNTASVSSDSYTRYGCTGDAGKTSFLNQNRPNSSNSGQGWVRSASIDSKPLLRGTGGNQVAIGDSPIFITRTGEPVYWSSGTAMSRYNSNSYYASSEKHTWTTPPDNTRVNMIMVSGLVPSRVNQPYGGLHNFPRFLENWKGKNLYMSGAFLQLNFSTYATGAFDQDAWEPGITPSSGTGCADSPSTSKEDICYYDAPNRIWGYDVGLQYAPAGPVAKRFKQPEKTRSEFYNEPPANDPYIDQLKKCTAANTCGAS